MQTAQNQNFAPQEILYAKKANYVMHSSNHELTETAVEIIKVIQPIDVRSI